VDTVQCLTPVIERCPVCGALRVEWRGIETVHLTTAGPYGWFEGRWRCPACGWRSGTGSGYTIYDAQILAGAKA